MLKRVDGQIFSFPVTHYSRPNWFLLLSRTNSNAILSGVSQTEKEKYHMSGSHPLAPWTSAVLGESLKLAVENFVIYFGQQ